MLLHHWYSNYGCSLHQRTTIWKCCKYWKFPSIARVEVSVRRMILKTGTWFDKDNAAAAQSFAEVVSSVCDDNCQKYFYSSPILQFTSIKIAFWISDRLRHSDLHVMNRLSSWISFVFGSISSWISPHKISPIPYLVIQSAITTYSYNKRIIF